MHHDKLLSVGSKNKTNGFLKPCTETCFIPALVLEFLDDYCLIVCYNNSMQQGNPRVPKEKSENDD